MRRRDFIALVGGTAGTWPLVARAQVSTKRPLIAVLVAVTRKGNPVLNAFVRGLRDVGYVEGQNVDIVWRFAEGRMDRFPELADELVRLMPDVIMVAVTPAAVAARKLTQTIPIVCPLLADPIRLGLIASVSRPGGNVTGLLFRIEGLADKQLELALELIPNVARIGLLVNVASGVVIDRQEAESASQRLGIKLIPAEVRTPDDLDAAFQALANVGVQAVLVLVDGMLFNERNRVAALAAAARLPAIYGFRDHVDAGGLISYGVNLADNFHRAAAYVDKILKGVKPGDLPVEFATKLEMVINLKSAKALGLTVPPLLLVRADEVIE
ncbi:ABC transporter substrate-binding protein [Bradyrhizobium sp. AUGA SZCCT0169]|uniref:ABC transporter substrate-binding protein n=1 Tax=Bradyrhizobium sp. AUGA SZCCT0169 TaxID=2807663 RepID=UPI001BAE1772|nr:ABC transporter substrate-binding protein [Bradyrhizobium sp. AUGA SZCCT0169]MBR1250013.1 ABC transporter substrate-binding protein [Bradyrhizobium sp. AUGA SZCCT0169]